MHCFNSLLLILFVVIIAELRAYGMSTELLEHVVIACIEMEAGEWREQRM
jgi:hypothetical protein